MENPKSQFVHEIQIPVRWCDMDAYGHVNNSVYFSYFEQARITWWDSITPADVSLFEKGPVIINAHCTFLRAITYPETITVKLFVGPPGTSSHECYYQILSASQPDILYAEGSTKVVWVDRQAERSTPLPDFIKNKLPLHTS